ncbi:hypothetical protein Pelo_11961 [Pelomyxa schiedti]|nr:hypothetical protein Pelo_11961 [Pelomyxa schiedti]
MLLGNSGPMCEGLPGRTSQCYSINGQDALSLIINGHQQYDEDPVVPFDLATGVTPLPEPQSDYMMMLIEQRKNVAEAVKARQKLSMKQRLAKKKAEMEVGTQVHTECKQSLRVDEDTGFWQISNFPYSACGQVEPVKESDLRRQQGREPPIAAVQERIIRERIREEWERQKAEEAQKQQKQPAESNTVCNQPAKKRGRPRKESQQPKAIEVRQEIQPPIVEDTHQDSSHTEVAQQHLTSVPTAPTSSWNPSAFMDEPIPAQPLPVLLRVDEAGRRIESEVQSRPVSKPVEKQANLPSERPKLSNPTMLSMPEPIPPKESQRIKGDELEAKQVTPQKNRPMEHTQCSLRRRRNVDY